MPSPNPGRPQSVRRPKVAGLRRPSPGPRPHGESAEAAEVTTADATETTQRTESSRATQPAVDETAEIVLEPGARPTPGPRRKKRDAGRLKPTDTDEAEAAVAEDEVVDEPGKRRREPRNPFVVAGALFGLALVLAGCAVFFKIQDNRIDAATSNTALLDVARTSQVNQAATSAVETLFSYDFNNIKKTQDAANSLLLNDEVKARYNSLMSQVQTLAPQQKIVVTVKASRSAVIMLNGDRARVMVFVDQTATRTDQNQTSSGSAQLYVNMQYTNGKWGISQLDTYNTQSPASPTTSPAPASGQQQPTSQAPASPSR